MKKFIIKIFGLHDLNDTIIKERKRQEEQDAEYWKERIEDEKLSLNRKHQLELLDYDIRINLLQEEIKTYKEREKEIEKREYQVKIQSKENSYIAQNIYNKMESFRDSVVKIVGEMKGVETTAKDLVTKMLEKK